jgi:hypothetical protein
MSNDRPVISPRPPSPAVIPLPLALYESNGMIFELYRGGQRYRPAVIRWERLKTFTVAREGDLTFNVRVSQAHLERPPE